jgi:hypothetical protein
MRNFIKNNYLLLNYSAIIVLAIGMTVIYSNVTFYDVTEYCTFVIIWSVVWISIVPMFVGNLAKKNHLKPKFWFIISIITTILPIIIAIICLANIPPYNSYGDDDLWRADMRFLNKIAFISALLPIASFLTFWLYRFFSGLDLSNEDTATIDTKIVYKEQTNLSQKLGTCQNCNTPVDTNATFCENCGNKLK